MEYEGKTFDGGSVRLDGNTYRNCTFTNVVFHYGGGEVNMSDCRMNHFSWQFDGDLAGGLYTLHQLFGLEGMIKIIRGFTEPTEGEIEI